MRGLSFKQFWLWAITELDKRIDNRTWKPPAHLIGQRIALHASLRKDPDSLPAIKRIARLSSKKMLEIEAPTGVIVATAIIKDFCDQSNNKWFFGPYGWILSDVYNLNNPVPCKGMLGLWRVPKDIEWEVMYQLMRDNRYLTYLDSEKERSLND